MATDQRIILKKITRTDGATISAEGRNCTLDVKCDGIGTSVTYTLGNVVSAVIISKGSLASISFTKSSQPLWMLLSIGCAVVGLLSFVTSLPDVWIGPLIMFGIISAIFYLLYYFSKMSVLEFDSSGAQTYAFQFSGTAANRSSDIALFCRAAIMNDLGLQEVENGDSTQVNQHIRIIVVSD